MASSSPDKGTPPSDMDCNPLGSPDFFRSLARAIDRCSGCMKLLAEIEGIGILGFKRCGACKTAWYCSSECQIADWRKEHKQVCEEVREDRVALLEIIPDPKFVAELEKWQRNSKLVFTLIIALKLQEAAVGMSRPGAPVTARDLIYTHCMAVGADYTPGRPRPFKISTECHPMPFDLLAEATFPGAQELRREVHQAKVAVQQGRTDFLFGEEAPVPSDDFSTYMIVRVREIKRVMKLTGPLDLLNGDSSDLVPRGMTVAALVDVINTGFEGDAITKSRAPTADQKTNCK